MKKILAIGHSFILAQNRDVFRWIHENRRAEITILAPRFFHGDLRDINIEDEPPSSSMRVLPIDCVWTQKVHFFSYNIFQLEKILSKQTFDAVYIWEEPYIVSGFTLAHICNKYKIPYFFYSCQNIYKKYPWPFSFFENKAQAHSVLSFACGFGVQQVMQEKQYNRFEVLPFFVSLERFQPMSKEKKQDVLHSLELKEKITVGFMGRFVEEKGIALFMKVVEETLKKQKCNIIVIGSGALETKLKKWLEPIPNTKVLSLKHHEVPQILPAVDILLCPSQTRKHWKEQFGRMIVEAFACGTMVIGSDSGEIPYVIGDAGCVVPEARSDLWVEVLEKMILSPELREEYIQKGILRAQSYSVESIGKKTIQKIEDNL